MTVGKSLRAAASFLPIVAFLILAQTQAVEAQQPDEPKGSPIDVVFVVDISGSTGGILTAIRDKFWEIQNEMTRLQPTADYRLGIVCMGRPSFKKENNFVQITSDLTPDIDAAAYPFFKYKDITAPGNYFLGNALMTAVTELNWSKDPKALKVMYMVGNGKPSAGPGVAKPVKLAKEKGIVIHSLYFLAYDNKNEQAEWKAIAEETGGQYAAIQLKDPNIHFEKPYDNELMLEACHMINTTYVYYGPAGADRFKWQAKLDEDAEMQGEMPHEARTFFKATSLYQGKNSSWDLVDLYRTGKIKGNINRKFLPEELQKKTDDELMRHIEEMSYNRGEYISIIKMLSTKREMYMRERREKMLQYRYGNTFFGHVNRSLVEMVEQKGYKHEF